MTDLDGLPAATRWTGHRALLIVGALEALSLLVLVVNLVTVHLAPLASALGPVHGLLYLSGIGLTFRATRATRPRLLSLVPAIGGLLAARYLR